MGSLNGGVTFEGSDCESCPVRDGMEGNYVVCDDRGVTSPVSGTCERFKNLVASLAVKQDGSRVNV